MVDSSVNQKIVLAPSNTPKLDIGENNLFSKQVDTNLWDSVLSKAASTSTTKEDDIQSQIFKVEQETQKYEQILSPDCGKNLDITG